MNILLIQLRRIGDLVLTTPAIAAIRQKFPDAQITLVASSECAALLPAIGGITRSFVMYRRPGDIATLLAIAKMKFDYCIDFTRNNRSALLTFVSRAQTRVGSHRIRRRSKIRRKAYTDFVQPRMRDMHTIDYNLCLLEPLGIRDVSPPVRLDIPDTAKERAKELLRHAGVKDSFAIFHPGSARIEKFWQPDRWVDVINHVTTQRQMTAVLTGGTSPQERNHLAEIEAKLPRPVGNASVVDLSGKMDLLTFAAVISHARLLVTVDTAPMHLATATRTPQVILFGPTNPFHWQPRQSPAHVLHGDSQTPVREFAPRLPPLPMKLISTGAVIDAMDSLLSTPAAPAL